jgi:predicted DCC family thiol-disulfide oxidoreductase YuxK
MRLGAAMNRAAAPYDYRGDPSVPAFPDDRPIIIFDGYCALCSGWVSFVLRHDRAAAFRLLPAQTALGAALYRHYRLDAEDCETNILLADGANRKARFACWSVLVRPGHGRAFCG